MDNRLASGRITVSACRDRRFEHAHVDEDVVGDQVGGAPLPQQLLEHIQRQLQLPRLDAHCSGGKGAEGSDSNFRIHIRSITSSSSPALMPVAQHAGHAPSPAASHVQLQPAKQPLRPWQDGSDGHAAGLVRERSSAGKYAGTASCDHSCWIYAHMRLHRRFRCAGSLPTSAQADADTAVLQPQSLS
jgi:hypothetical protein